MRRPDHACGLAGDARGATLLEFALILPILMMLLLAGLDYGHTLYMQAVLQGTLQKAARDSTLETGSANSDALDATVSNQVKLLQKQADVTFSRRYYRTFATAAAAKAESFTDSNNDKTCNGPQGGSPGESYVDANNNGVWDKDGGDSGQGGARDIVVYKATISYARMFPLDRIFGGSGITTVSAQTVLANQPYGDQASYTAPTVRQCT